MLPEELRKGQLVEYRGQIYRVMEVRQVTAAISGRLNETSAVFENLEPLPIRKGFLERNGFTEYSDGWLLDHTEDSGQSFRITLQDLGARGYRVFCKHDHNSNELDDSGAFGVIKGVHELQDIMNFCKIKYRIRP